MRYRDIVGYNRGEQTKEKLQLITFLGWTINSRKWDPENAIYKLDLTQVQPRDKVTLWYTMFGQQTPLPNPFPATKRIRQFNEILDLTVLRPRKHYAVWCVNVTDIEGIDKSGYWYWVDVMQLTNSQATDVLTWKRTRQDVDAVVPRMKLDCIAEMGYPHGNQFYDMLVELYGDEPKRYEYKLAYDKYMAANGKAKVGKKLKQFDDKVQKERQLNDLLEF